MAQIRAFPQQRIAASTGQPGKVLSTKTVLEELFILLEDYAPTWYTLEHHDRAIAALLERES